MTNTRVKVIPERIRYEMRQRETRERRVMKLVAAGWSYEKIAKQLHLSPQRIGQLVERARKWGYDRKAQPTWFEWTPQAQWNEIELERMSQETAFK